MADSSQPLVSVVTPVYNGGKYLTQCIESVVSQNYDNWEYIIVNNCSTDESLDIANRYAQRDSRIKVYSTTELLKATANFNYSLQQISASSKYCKIVHADDWLFPDCLRQMVKVSEAHPSVVLVSSYRLIGQKVGNDCLSYPSFVIPGGDAGRSFLLGKYNVFGNPSATMIRADVIRNRGGLLYEEEGNVHQSVDCQVCLEVLKNGDLGFVHQVLTFSREHADSISSKIGSFAAYHPERLHLIKQYGGVYLTPEQYAFAWKTGVSAYARALALNVFLAKGKKFWQFHRTELQKLGCSIGPFRLGIEAVRVVANMMLQPFQRLLYWRKAKRSLADSESPVNVL